jgi:hypothetical protein
LMLEAIFVVLLGVFEVFVLGSHVFKRVICLGLHEIFVGIFLGQTRVHFILLGFLVPCLNIIEIFLRGFGSIHTSVLLNVMLRVHLLVVVGLPVGARGFFPMDQFMGLDRLPEFLVVGLFSLDLGLQRSGVAWVWLDLTFCSTGTFMPKKF